MSTRTEPGPRERLLAIFDKLAVVVTEPDLRGYRYLAADLALADPSYPGHAVTREYRGRVTRLLADELGKLGHPHPVHAADQLMLLIDGALAAGATRPRHQPRGSRAGTRPAGSRARWLSRETRVAGRV